MKLDLDYRHSSPEGRDANENYAVLEKEVIE